MTATGAKKWDAFFQALSIFLREDYKFPLLEVFAFLFVISLILGSFTGGISSNMDLLPMGYVSSSILSFLVFLILIWKNLSTGFGGEFDKGVMQTFLVYPLSRRLILLARLISAVGVALGLLILAQFAVFYLVARGFFLSNLGAFSYLYLIALGDIFLITALVLLTTVISKSASVPLVIGVLLFFGITILSAVLTGYATFTSNYSLLVGIFVIDPFLSLQTYNSPSAFPNGVSLSTTPPLWTPTTQNVILIVIANYAISLVIVILVFIYFSRRVEP